MFSVTLDRLERRGGAEAARADQPDARGSEPAGAGRGSDGRLTCPPAAMMAAPAVIPAVTRTNPAVTDPVPCSKSPAATNPIGPEAEISVWMEALTRARSGSGVRIVAVEKNHG